MTLIDIIQRQPVPAPWAEGEKIPWNEPGFSRRMLQEHLSQAHDAASRRMETIDRHVAWIHQTILQGQPTKILDLGCGPGFYSNRLAQRGHACVGIDFSPASIAYANEQKHTLNTNCTFLESDIRTAEYGNGYGLVMLIFGEFNVFRREDAKRILTKAFHALQENGQLLLEPHTFSAVRALGEQPPTWYSSESGLFSERPHLVLNEHFWDAQANAATNRYFILDVASGDVTPYADSMQAYTDDEYHTLLHECGFENIQIYPSLRGDADPSQSALMVLVGQKQSKA